MTLVEAVVLAVIEGVTEFLPVSSTGHMIIGSSLMGMKQDDFTKLYIVAIQLGAILSVLVLYFKRFFQDIDFYFKLLVAFIPAAILGVLFSDKIDALLESPTGVAVALLVGGIILLLIDRFLDASEVTAVEQISYSQAFKIGLFQCLSMIPGTSRSAATIIGGMAQGVNRSVAAEFSFFLAVPTMFGATAKKLFDFYDAGYVVSTEEIKLLAVGNIVAFVVAMIAIKSFIAFLQKRGFSVFGLYRIIVGAIILVFILTGRDLQIV
jgi:undecaprenyl-diphosphatase